MKIYLAGPMTGLPDFNYPRFKEKAAELRSMGHEVKCPTEHKYDVNNFPLREAFADIANYICNEADAIYLLDGWHKSHGARIEHDLAVYLGLFVCYPGQDFIRDICKGDEGEKDPGKVSNETKYLLRKILNRFNEQ